jgi:hypothetical protein
MQIINEIGMMTHTSFLCIYIAALSREIRIASIVFMRAEGEISSSSRNGLSSKSNISWSR